MHVRLLGDEVLRWDDPAVVCSRSVCRRGAMPGNLFFTRAPFSAFFSEYKESRPLLRAVITLRKKIIREPCKRVWAWGYFRAAHILLWLLQIFTVNLAALYRFVGIILSLFLTLLELCDFSRYFLRRWIFLETKWASRENPNRPL